jgi:hypothetical protein
MLWAFSVAYHFWCLSLEFDGFFLNRKYTLGALSFRRSVAHPEPPTPSSSNEVMQVEASRGSNSDPPQRDVVGDTPSAPVSSDVAVLKDE